MNASTRSPLSPQYLRRIAAQLLPLSKAQHSPLEALSEWRCSLSPGSTIVYEEPVTCELCLEESLLTHYLIENVSTSRSLWVGSTCIERPLLAVYAVDGRRLDQGEVRAALKSEARRAQEAARVRRLTDLISQAAALEPDEDDQRYWRQIGEQLVEKRALTPCRLDYLLLALDYLHLPRPEAKDLKVEAKKEHHQRDLVDFPKPAWERVEPYLSAAQRETAEWRRNPRPAAAPPSTPPPATLDEDDFEEELRDYWRQPGASHAGVLDFFDQWDRRQATKSR